MSEAAEHFASIDRQLADARAAWQDERAALEKRILELQTELAIRTSLHERCEDRTRTALQTTAKLLAQFGVVSAVFEEARQLAIASGLYEDRDKPDSPGVEAAKAAIDRATRSGPPEGMIA